jgi:parvulin-like peptidyl-prolyl isomerase
MRKRRIGALIVGLGLSALAALAPAEIVEEIVAKINDQVITMSEVEERESLLVQEMFQRFAGQELDEQMEEGRRRLLQNMIAERLLLERGEAMIPDMDRVREDLLENFIKNEGITDREELERLLKQAGLTLEQFQEQLVRVAIPKEVLEYELRGRIEIPEQEMLDYYHQHEDDYRQPEVVAFRELVLLARGEEREEGRARIDRYREEVLQGADFENLIREHSQAPSRNKGGEVGPFQRDDLVPEIAAVVFSLQEGELSQIVEMPHGFHLIRLEEHREASVTSFEEVREDIRFKLENDSMDAATHEYILELWEKSYVYIYPRYRDRLDREFLDISDLGAGASATP